jgi:hypothetical protein
VNGTFRQVAIPADQLARGVFGPHNRLVPCGGIAALSTPAAELAASTGPEFAESFDEGDTFDIALLVDSRGREVALLERRDPPVKCTEVHANVPDPETAECLLTDVLAALQLDPGVVIWRRREEPASMWPS